MENRNRETHSTRFLPNSVDRFGRPIDPGVFRIAEEIAPRAVSYGERLLGDSAVALTLFEEAAASVSRALREEVASGDLHVREMRRYLFRCYLRRISAARRAESSVVTAAESLSPSLLQNSDPRTIEAAVVLRELQDRCDSVTRIILQRRLAGCSWKQIEREFGISANAAALRLRRAIRQLQTPSTRTTELVPQPSALPKSTPLPSTSARRLERAS